MTRRMNHYSVPSWHPWLVVALVGAVFVGLGTLAMPVQIYVSVRRRDALRDASGDPWNGRSLEWSTPSPAPLYNSRAGAASARLGFARRHLRCTFSLRRLLYGRGGTRDDGGQCETPWRPFVRCRAGITARVPGSSHLNPQSLRPPACGAAGNGSGTRVPEPPCAPTTRRGSEPGRVPAAALPKSAARLAPLAINAPLSGRRARDVARRRTDGRPAETA